MKGMVMILVMVNNIQNHMKEQFLNDYQDRYPKKNIKIKSWLIQVILTKLFINYAFIHGLNSYQTIIEVWKEKKGQFKTKFCRKQKEKKTGKKIRGSYVNK